MKKSSSQKIAITSILLSLIAILSFTPLGFLPIVPGVIDMAFIFLLVVIVAAQLEGLWVGVICSTFFGICSFVKAFITPSVLAICFQNPLVSIVPRIAIGFAVFFSFAVFKKLFGKSKNECVRSSLASALSAIVGVCTNTLLVLGFMSWGYGSLAVSADGATVAKLISSVILVINFPIELITGVVFVPLLYVVLQKVRRRF